MTVTNHFPRVVLGADDCDGVFEADGNGEFGWVGVAKLVNNAKNDVPHTALKAHNGFMKLVLMTRINVLARVGSSTIKIDNLGVRCLFGCLPKCLAKCLVCACCLK